MKIAVLGINHKLASLPLREAITKAFYALFHTHHPFFTDPYVLLDTCNRTELYFSSNDTAQTHATILEYLKRELNIDFEQKLYSFFSHECFLHLAKVTSGLDSALLGETEIQGQVKNAYEKARLQGPLCKELHFLFQKALKIGKDVRKNVYSHYPHLCLNTSLLSLAAKHYSNIEEVQFLLVGASDVNKKLLSYLVRRGCQITLTNRTDSKVLEWQNSFPMEMLPWKDLQRWNTYDVVITATTSRQHLIKNCPADNIRTKLLIDLSVPRNIDPKLARCPGISLFHIDRLHKLARKDQKSKPSQIDGAEEFITKKVGLYLKLYNLKPAIVPDKIGISSANA